jgi:glutathione synthase/RimK-type ligase-like ATP-grasp enzyme
MGDPSLLFIMGTDRPERLRIDGRNFRLAGSTDLYQLLGPDVPFHRLQMTPNYFRQARRPDLDGYDCYLNLITEPEENRKVLENLRKLLRGRSGRIVNRPEAVLQSTRDQVSRRLAGVPGAIVPKVARVRGGPAASRAIERAGLNFPLILRQAGTHTGNIVGKFESPAELAAALPDSGECIATEFVDFASPDGLYRKFRVFCIGRQLIFRHMLVSAQWNVHAKDRDNFMQHRPNLIAEEAERFDLPVGGLPESMVTALHAIRERMGLDFFGVDFGIATDGRLILFEANATMNFIYFPNVPEFAYLKACIAPASRALRELVGLAPDSKSEA